MLSNVELAQPQAEIKLGLRTRLRLRVQGQRWAERRVRESRLCWRQRGVAAFWLKSNTKADYNLFIWPSVWEGGKRSPSPSPSPSLRQKGASERCACAPDYPCALVTHTRRRSQTADRQKGREFKDVQVQGPQVDDEMNSSGWDSDSGRPKPTRNWSRSPATDRNECGLVGREGAKSGKRLLGQKSCHVVPERICRASHWHNFLHLHLCRTTCTYIKIAFDPALHGLAIFIRFYWIFSLGSGHCAILDVNLQQEHGQCVRHSPKDLCPVTSFGETNFTWSWTLLSAVLLLAPCGSSCSRIFWSLSNYQWSATQSGKDKPS